MQAEVVVDARRAALEPADDDQVRQLRVAFAAPAQAALAIGRVALAGTRAHRLVGGVAGGGGGRVCVSVSGTSVASLAAMPLADLQANFEALLQARGGILPPSLGNPLDAVRARPALPAGDAAGPRLGLAQRAARRLSGQARSPSCRSPPPTWPGPGSTRSSPPTPATSTKVFLVKRQIPDSSYPAVTSSFLVQTVFDTSVGILVLLYAISQGLLPPLPRIPDLPAFEISFWADHPKLFLITVGVAAAGDRDRHLLARPPRAPLLGAGPPGPGHPHRAAPLPARGLRLAGGRLALPLRRLLVLPRGLRDRRLGRQRDAGDERAGDRQHRPLHPGRRRRPAGAAGGDPARARRGPRSSPSRSGPRSRWRPGRSCSASPRSCSSSGRPTGAA